MNDEKNFYDDFGSYDVHDVWEGMIVAKRALSSYSTRSYNWGLGQNLNHKKPRNRTCRMEM